MNHRLYSFFAALVLAVLYVLAAGAQERMSVVELQTLPDGTQVPVEKTIEVPRKAAKVSAATVTAEEDDLQYYLNHIVKTRAGESAVVIDLSTFSATTRQTTLEVNQGISIKFTNGTLKRGTGLAKGDPIIKISNSTVVEFDKTVTISGENLETNGNAVDLQDASLKTAAWIGNLKKGTENSYSVGIYASSFSAKLEIIGGTIAFGGITYYGTEPLIVSGGNVAWTRIYSETDAMISGENTLIDISFEYKKSQLYLKSAVKNLKFYDYYNVISDGYAIATGYDGYQLTESDLQKIYVYNYDTSVNDLDDYEKRLEGNSIVMRKKVKDLQTAINNAADGTETTFNVSDYDELTKGILIPTGKKIKLTATSNVTLASNFSGDYIFRTEGDAQLDITVPGFSGYSSTALPKYGLVAGGSASKIIVNQSGTNTLALPNTLLATENGGTIDCYANISTKGIYNAAGGTMNIYSESGEVETFTDEGGTVNITGPVKFYSTFTSLGTATLLSENVTSLAKLVLGKQSSMTFTSKWVKPTSLNISFKDNDYVLDQTYITFEKSTTMLSGFETVRFTLQSEHSAYLDNDTHQLSIEEVDGKALTQLDAQYKEIQYYLQSRDEDLRKLSYKIDNYYNQGLLTEIEYQNYKIYITDIYEDISVANQYLSRYQGLRPVFYGTKSVDECNAYVNELKARCEAINEEIAKLEADVENLAASRKKTFSNTDDLQDYLNSLAENKGTTPSDPAKLSVADGTEIEDIEIPEGTHVEIDITDKDGNSGTDDLQAYLNGLVTVKEGGSLKLTGKYVISGGALNPRIDVRGIIDIYATIVVEGTREEVIHVYSGGKVNWRGEMQGGKIVNEGELNHYSGSTDYIENRGTANHRGGVCHHVVNYVTYYLYGGTIDGSASPYTCAFENHGTARLTGGTIIHRQTLIYIVKGATTYIDGSTLDDSNATTTVLAYDDFHIRGDYAPKNIVIDNGVCIHFITVWTVRWHITFIDNRTTIRKVIFHSDVFDVNDEYIKYIDFTLPDRYRWYWNQTANGLEIRDDKVFDADDLQHFLDLLKTRPGTASDPVVLDGGSHTVPLPLDESGVFRFPGNTYIIVRDIIFRYVSPAAKRRWTVPSGSTVVLRNVTIDGGEGASDYEDADIFVDGGTLYIDNVVFVNIHLNITRTIYISSAVKSWIYIRYTKDGSPAAGDRIAEGVDMYYLWDSDAQWFRHIDYDGSQNLWQFRRNGNVIELYLSDPSGIAAVEADGTARAYVSPDGTLRLSGIPADEPCAVFRTDGTFVAKGTAADLTARPVILAPGAYILRSRTVSMKFVR